MSSNVKLTDEPVTTNVGNSPSISVQGGTPTPDKKQRTVSFINSDRVPGTNNTIADTSIVVEPITNNNVSKSIDFRNNFTTGSTNKNEAALTSTFNTDINKVSRTELTNIYTPTVDIINPSSVVELLPKTDFNNDKNSLTTVLPSRSNNNQIDLVGKTTTRSESIPPSIVNEAPNNFHNTVSSFDKISSTRSQSVSRPNVNLYDSVLQVPPINNQDAQEDVVTGSALNVYPQGLTIEEINIDPTNTNSAYGINGADFIEPNGGLALSYILRNITEPLPADVTVIPPGPRFNERLLGVASGQTVFNSPSQTTSTLRGNVTDTGVDPKQLIYDEVGTAVRPDLATVESLEPLATPVFTGGASNAYIPAIDPLASAQANFVPGTAGLDVANAHYFLQSVLATPAGSLPKGALWAVSFRAPSNTGNNYEGGIPFRCINKINMYEPANYGEWNTSDAINVLSKESYNGQKGCMFAQSVQLPNESYTAQPEGTIQKNGLIQSYVGLGRNVPTTLRISFLETNVDFVDNIIRPWTIMTGHLGLLARTGEFNYRTNVTFYKIGLTSYSQPPTVLAEYNFYGICPVNVDSHEYTYASDGGPSRRTAEFIYHYYTMSSVKNTHASVSTGQAPNIPAGGSVPISNTFPGQLVG